ncbi:hypothetical protein QN277_014700 [Acacia crassicarpa]|uniref:Uncharacterized protein n=1 Tax=Acacia crassicarpa TaxID=499986 RepID=A0AAE1JYX6_9FABA|nr:hypothetical protein QN277_014700 [Acacia crassicarpa]
MSERTFVPIFVFWAFLTIITPTLVLLSENSKRDFYLYGNSTEVADSRRMMDYREYAIKKTTPRATAVAVEELTPAPAQAPIVSLVTGANLTASHRNGSLGSNTSDHGLTQVVFPRKHLKQTKPHSMQLAGT